jgi:PAS domain S-box-containing protein
MMAGHADDRDAGADGDRDTGAANDDRDTGAGGTVRVVADPQLLGGLLAAVRDVVWTSTADGRFLFINDATETVYGRPRETFLTSPEVWLEAVHPEDRARVAEASAALSQGAEALELEYRIIWPDGSVRWLRDRKTAIRDAEGRVVQLGGIAADITPSKDAEVLLRSQHEQLEREFTARTEQLRGAEQRYRNLFENAGDPMYSLDPQGQIAALNSAWERVTGHRREAWVGQSFVPLVHPEDLPATRARFEAALGGEPQLYEARYRAADGAYRLAEHTLAPQQGTDGAVTEIIGVARDITARREAEVEQRRIEQHLQQIQKLESLGLLAGGIAHDFNNLLVGVLCEADLALQDLPADAPLRESLETIIASAKRLADMANQMLAYSGKGRFMVARVDLSDVVREMVRLLRTSLPKKITLACDLCREPLEIEADTGQLQQVVMNLIINAAEATGDAGGTVQIRTGTTCLEQELLPAGWPGEQLAPGRYLVLEVTDAGDGMDGEILERIFEPFFSSKAAGRGLGLAAVLGIVRGHGGAIEVHSAPGQGSTFRALLRPATGRREGEEEPARPVALPSGSGVVLVVDDEPLVRGIARRILVRAGYSVVTAEDGQEALELLEARDGAVDLVLLDLTMPRLDGPDTFRELRRRWPELPLIVASGYDQRQLPEEMLECCTFLHKPYRATVLAEAVQLALKPRRA